MQLPPPCEPPSPRRPSALLSAFRVCHSFSSFPCWLHVADCRPGRSRSARSRAPTIAERPAPFSSTTSRDARHSTTSRDGHDHARTTTGKGRQRRRRQRKEAGKTNGSGMRLAPLRRLAHFIPFRLCSASSLCPCRLRLEEARQNANQSMVIMLIGNKVSVRVARDRRAGRRRRRLSAPALPPLPAPPSPPLIPRLVPLPASSPFLV